MTRDWASGAGAIPDGIEVSGLDGARVDPSVDEAVAVVVPRASDVDRMEAIVADAGGIPVLIVNPDLVDMGVTGLSLNARQLRERFIDAFETAYYLKVFPWGVVLRAYPGRWALWRNDTEAEGGYSLVAELDRRPSAGDIEKALGDGAGEGDGQGALQGFFSGLSRFLKLYSKG